MVNEVFLFISKAFISSVDRHCPYYGATDMMRDLFKDIDIGI